MLRLVFLALCVEQIRAPKVGQNSNSNFFFSLFESGKFSEMDGVLPADWSFQEVLELLRHFYITGYDL